MQVRLMYDNYLMILIVFVALCLFASIIVWILSGRKQEPGTVRPSTGGEQYDREGRNPEGYTLDGIDRNGVYNRYYDRRSYETCRYSKDGFLDPRYHPVKSSPHAFERITERKGVVNSRDMEQLVWDAYCYGKSARQVSKNTAIDFYELEKRHDGGTVLLYKNYIYIFSEDNTLITMYKNNRNWH